MSIRKPQLHNGTRAGIIPVLVLCAVIVLGLAFASFYPAEEALHDCSGEDCPICAHIDQYCTLEGARLL